MSDESEILDYSEPIECDVAIAGATYGGMAAGAILARSGKRVVIGDTPPVIGGRGGSQLYRGYWIDAGHRAGRDTTDMQATVDFSADAAREAGVELRIAPVLRGLRIHLVPGSASESPRVLKELDWGVEGFSEMAVDAFGCRPGVVGSFVDAITELGNASEQDREAAKETPLGTWLETNISEPSVKTAILNMVKSLYSEFPERASLGRLMDMMTIFSDRQTVGSSQSGLPDDEEVGGMGGMIAPFTRAFEAAGGRIILDHEPSHVTFSGERATGLVALSPNHFILRIRSQQTILAWPVWDALKMLPGERIDPKLAEISRQLEDHKAIAMGWAVGLNRLPKIRETGETESFDGWNRLLVGVEREFSGGFHLPSLGSRRAAPEGKHLLHCMIMRWVRRDEERPWDVLEATLERARNYLHHYYSDLEDCIDWHADQYIRRPAMTGWYWAPVKRHGVEVTNCENLYLAGATVESNAGPSEISVHGGLMAARKILKSSR